MPYTLSFVISYFYDTELFVDIQSEIEKISILSVKKENTLLFLKIKE